MIVEFETGKVKGFFVKQENVFDFQDASMAKINLENEKDYTVLGYLHKLSNEQKELICDKLNNLYADYCFSGVIARGKIAYRDNFSLQDSFSSLLLLHNINVVNPYIKPNEGTFNRHYIIWRQAEERTGNWIVLIKQK